MLSPSDARELVRQVIGGASEANLAAIGIQVHPFLLARSTAYAHLASTNLGERLQGLAMACIELGGAGNPETAENLASALIDATLELERRSNLPARFNALRVATNYALGQAQLRLGKFDQLCDRADAWHRSPDAGQNELYDAAIQVQKATALALRLQVTQAREILEPMLVSPIRAQIFGLESALQMVRKYEIHPDQHVEPFDRATAIRGVLAGCELLGDNLADWKQSLTKLADGTGLGSEVRQAFDHLNAIQQQMVAFRARPDLQERSTAADFHRLLFEFQSISRVLLSGDPALNGFDLQDVVECNSYGTMIEADERSTITEIEDAIMRVNRALSWSQRTDELHHRVNSLYLLARLQRRLPGGEAASFAAARKLLDVLVEARNSPERVESVLNFTGSHRGLFPILAAHALAHSDFDLLFEALEFRKGRRLDRMAGPEEAVPAGAANLLGPRTHYVSFAALEEDNSILFLLRSALGTLRGQALRVTPAELRDYAALIDPIDWDRRPMFGKGAKSTPRETFARLMAGIEAALDDGLIASGDHLVVAAEDPVIAIPTHLLPLAGRPAHLSVTMSRCASFADARRIYLSPNARPRSAAIVFSPAAGESAIEEKREATKATASALAASALLFDRDATLANYFMIQPSHDLLHIVAHGQRAHGGENPMDRAGVRLAEPDRLADRSHTHPALLSPRAVLQGPEFPASAHVSLVACVTGLAKRGEAGDNLGLELACRMRGAASVLASHWHVEWRTAFAFLDYFYENWLRGGMSRAEAWRLANAMVVDDAIAGGAFSLYGDWR